MKRFIAVTFLFLGWGYYEMSGGADFVPQSALAETPAAEAAPEMVTRADGAALDTRPILPASAPESVAEVAAEPATSGAGEGLSLPLVQAAAAPAEAAPEGEPGFGFDTAAEALTAASANVPAAASDIREIAASRVNMRQGPGTTYGVIDTLDGGTAMEVLEAGADGWVRVRSVDSGIEGWMAERLLTPAG